MIRKIGITGGVGAGKSRILSWLEKEQKAKVILTDDVAKELMEPGEEGYIQVTGALGTSFLNEDGSINRPALAKLIFEDSRAREMVNRITHPLVWQRVQARLKKAEQEGFALAVVESALFNRKARDFLDELWYIHASKETRIARLTESRGYSRERCRFMLESQPSEEFYRSIATDVINNDGSWEETEGRLKARFAFGPFAGHE